MSLLPRLLRTEWPFLVSLATTVLFLAFGHVWLADLSNSVWFALMLGWLFAAILISAFAVVRHADALADQLGEPFGTIVFILLGAVHLLLFLAYLMLIFQT